MAQMTASVFPNVLIFCIIIRVFFHYVFLYSSVYTRNIDKVRAMWQGLFWELGNTGGHSR